MSIEERVAVRDLAIPNYIGGDLYVYRRTCWLLYQTPFEKGGGTLAGARWSCASRYNEVVLSLIIA